MKYHAKAALTQTQRTRVRELAEQGVAKAALARQFGVSRTTIARWAARPDPADRSSAPHTHGRQVVTDDYRQTVTALRTTSPHYGPARIAQELRDRFPTANAATVWRILNDAGLSTRAQKKTDAPPH